MKTSSAKAKGRNLQKWVVSQLVEHFPYSIECKNQEKVNVWSAYEQAESNCKGYEPVVVIKKNRKKPLVVIDAEYFVKLHEEKEI